VGLAAWNYPKGPSLNKKKPWQRSTRDRDIYAGAAGRCGRMSGSRDSAMHVISARIVPSSENPSCSTGKIKEITEQLKAPQRKMRRSSGDIEFIFTLTKIYSMSPELQ
jgi:hypothetical protein